MGRMATVRLVGLAVVTASLAGVGAGLPAAAAVQTFLVPQSAVVTLAERDGRTWLRVNPEGVTFDGDDVGDGARLEYTVRPVDGSQSRWFGRTLTDAERNAGWAPFTEAPAQFPDGYCVSWLRLDGSDWGEWMHGPVCWEPVESEGEQPQSGGDGADPTPTATAGSGSDNGAGNGSGRKPTPSTPADEKKPASEPTATPSPEPSPSAPSSSPSPTPSGSPSASSAPNPSLYSDRSDPAGAIIDSFEDTPARAESETSSQPRSGDLTWLWVLLAGFGAAAGGVVIMLRRSA